MQQFNVLDRNLEINRHYLLEASAGTGKTYSIQNIFVRLLIESKDSSTPLPIQKILAVTFTRAATRDLKIRIRTNIEETLALLTKWDDLKNSTYESAPDYLKAIMERGIEAVDTARQRLQLALFTFDQCQIFTIHSFCARMLRQYAMECDLGLNAFATEDPLPKSEMLALIRDFFRTELRQDKFSPAQLEILLKDDPQKNLLKLVQTGHDFPLLPSYQMTFQSLHEKLSNLKHSFNLSSQKLIDDFHFQAGSFRNHKGAKTKAHTLALVTRFANLFDKDKWDCNDLDCLIEDGLIWTKALDASLLKGKMPDSANLHFSRLIDALQNEIEPIVDNLRNYGHLLARLANDCHQHLTKYLHEEEKFSPDDVLRKMDEALTNPSFISKVQMTYDAAIIDEFQDTDPLQWRIFRTLFLSDKGWGGFLFLVGDPKQSIYSFRQADIYTYLSAAEALGSDNCRSLSINYRSEAPLVRALNTLFSSEHLPHFISLPKNSKHLFYTAVQAAQKQNSEETLSLKTSSAIHFFIADTKEGKKAKLTDLEDRVFFPFIANEITLQRLKKGVGFHSFAVLVRDRHQAKRLAAYFDSLSIPYLNQRGASLAGEPAHRALTDTMRALFNLHDRGIVRTALCTPLFAWSYDEIKDPQSMEFILLLFQQLKSILYNQGFTVFFQEMLQSKCKKGKRTILEQLLLQERGLEFFRDLQQIADIVTDHQFEGWNTPEGIVPFLDLFHLFDENELPGFKRFQNPADQGVKILTLHYSKGLEFEIVFALGLINRTSINEELFPIESDGRIVMTPVREDSIEYLRHCEEIDAEKMRQLYVALTRAKSKLYVPAILHFPVEKLKMGEASPLELYTARLHQPLGDSYEALYDRIKSQENNLIDFLETLDKNEISYSIHAQLEASHISQTRNEKIATQLIPPSPITVFGKSLWMTSFSTLSRHLEENEVSSSIVIDKRPNDFECSSKNIHTLPANHETGLLIHKILEKLSFEDFKGIKRGEDALSLIRPFLHHSSLQEWELPIAQMIFNTLNTPITLGNDCFCLSDIKTSNLYREMPFVFPYNEKKMIENIEIKEGLVKGVIDALFFYNGLYYLIDWKTNWLGAQCDSYAPATLEIAMQESAYFLQCALYKEAIKRYLRLVEKRPFEECFGGSLYLFLRGMEPGKMTGIYFIIV